MSNVHRADPYRKLIRITIALAIAFVLILTAYLLVDSYRRGQYEEQQKKVVEENNAIISEYNEAVRAQQSQLGQVEAPVWPQAAAEGIDILNLKDYEVQAVTQEPVSRAEALRGSLMVVNRWHALPADFGIVEGELQSIMDTTERRVPVDARVISLFPEAITALDQMVAAAGEEGIANFLVRGGYRSMETQTGYWEVEAARYTDRLTGDALTEQVRKSVSYPGTSDYQSGHSIEIDAYSGTDPVLNSMRFVETDQAKWLFENAHKYGFVWRFPNFRYPQEDTVDKSFKTGVSANVDALRYVGVPHALVMRELDLCLEEYVEYLIENKHIAVYEDGVLKYEIYRAGDIYGDAMVPLPEGVDSYSTSADNLGGLVVAASY